MLGEWRAARCQTDPQEKRPVGIELKVVSSAGKTPSSFSTDTMKTGTCGKVTCANVAVLSAQYVSGFGTNRGTVVAKL
jgi:hypothetical protein